VWGFSNILHWWEFSPFPHHFPLQPLFLSTWFPHLPVDPSGLLILGWYLTLRMLIHTKHPCLSLRSRLSVHQSHQHPLILVNTSILIWSVIKLLLPYMLLTLSVHMKPLIPSFLQKRPSWKSWIP
jgi:hypothetical protein